MLKSVFQSKKALACIVGLVAVVLSMLLGKLGVSIPEDRIEEMVALLCAYVLGQGISDFGKGAKQVDAPKPPPPPVA